MFARSNGPRFLNDGGAAGEEKWRQQHNGTGCAIRFLRPSAALFLVFFLLSCEQRPLSRALPSLLSGGVLLSEMGPGLYSDIGKKARDLLYKDYQTDQKFVFTTCAANGVAITSSGTKKNDLIFGEIQAQVRKKGVTTDLKVNSDSSLLTTVTIEEFAPRFKTIFSFIVPDQRSGKVELQYVHDYAGVNTSFGLNANPIVNFASVIGTDTLHAGVDLSFDTASGNLTKYNAAVSIINTDLIASVTLNDKGDNLTAAYYHVVNPLTSTAVGGELSHCFSSNENTLTFGTQHALDPLTTVKARVNNFGKASALIQHEWRPKSLVTLSGELDTKAIEKSSKVGLSLLLKA